VSIAVGIVAFLSGQHLAPAKCTGYSQGSALSKEPQQVCQSCTSQEELDANLVVSPSQAIQNFTQRVGKRCVDRSDRSCPPGHFGEACAHDISTVYFEHEVYQGFTPLLDAKAGGWSPGQEFYEQRVREISPTLIIEVGVWRGLSLGYLASAMKQLTGGGTIFAVDTWLGAPEFWNRRFTNGKFDPTRDMRLKNGYPQVYFDFLSNVVNNGIQDVVIPLPVPSLIAAQLFREMNVSADIIHIDAAHEYESVTQDIELWFPLLDDCGMLLGDDWSPSWMGVIEAVCEFACKHNVNVHTMSNKWWILKEEVLNSRVDEVPDKECIRTCVSK